MKLEGVTPQMMKPTMIDFTTNMPQTTATMNSETTIVRIPTLEVCCKRVKLCIVGVDGLPVVHHEGHIECIGVNSRHQHSHFIEKSYGTNSVTEGHDLVTQYNQKEVYLNH